MEDKFWNRVKGLIKDKGMTQAEFAEQNGFSVNTFLGWISKNRSPDLDIAVVIAEQLDTTVDYLITGKTQELSTEENKLLNLYRGVPDLCKPIILNIAEQLAGLKGKIN